MCLSGSSGLPERAQHSLETVTNIHTNPEQQSVPYGLVQRVRTTTFLFFTSARYNISRSSHFPSLTTRWTSDTSGAHKASGDVGWACPCVFHRRSSSSSSFFINSTALGVNIDSDNDDDERTTFTRQIKKHKNTYVHGILSLDVN